MRLLFRKQDCFVTVFLAMTCLINQVTTVFAGIGTVGGLFLQEDIGARPLGMGSAFTAVVNDSNGIYSNPAALDYTTYPEIMMMYKKGFLDTYYGAVGYIHPLGENGTFEVGVMIVDGGSIQLNYLNGQTETRKMEQDIVTTVGYSRNLSFLRFPDNLGEMIFLGANAKLIQSTLGEKYSANTVAADMGLLFRTIDTKLSFSMVIQNCGTGLKYQSVTDTLPTTIKIGSAYKVREWAENSIVTAVDLVQTLNEPLKINLGAELWLSKLFALRAGYKIGYNPDVFTCGLGFSLYKAQLDYAYIPSALDITHRISMTIKFGSQERKDIAKKYEEKGMYERAEYVRSPENYQYAKAGTSYERNQFRPIITSIEPEKATPGSEVTIYGTKFDEVVGNVEVQIGGYKATVIETNPRKIRVKIPLNVRAGDTNVYVQTSRGVSEQVTFGIIPSKSPMLTISGINFEDPNGNGILESEENSKIILNISNARGAGEAFNIKTNLKISNPKIDINYKASTYVGNIRSGESKRVEIPVNAGLNIPSEEVSFAINFIEANGFNPDPAEIKIKTHKLEPPDIQLAKIEIDDGIYPDRPEKLAVGNNNGKIEPGESVEIVATVINKGTGSTKNAAVDIVSANPNITFLTEKQIYYGEIKPGQWKEIKFAVRIEKKYSQIDNLPLTLNITDKREQFNKDIPLNVAAGKVYPKVQFVEVKGKAVETASVEMPTFGDELLKVPATKTVNNDAVGVIVGVKDYKNKDVPSVEYALNDAQLMKEYLVKVLGYREGNIIYLENPTKGDFERVFGTRENHMGQLNNYVKSGVSDVFIYYTGHGAPDLDTNKAYFVPADCHPDYVKLNGYSVELFYDNVKKIPAKSVTMVIDACFSGSSQKGMILAKASSITVVQRPSMPGGMDTFTSTSKEEVASWYTEKQHSLFTYFFLKALQGDADKNQDKNLTLGEIKEYITENVPYLARRMYNRNQTPEFYGDENKILVKY